MEELQPLNENVLLDITEDAKETTTESGIIIPDTAKEKPQHGKVVAVGNVQNPAVNAGDRVYYKKFSGTELEAGGKQYLLIPYGELLAKVVETESI